MTTNSNAAFKSTKPDAKTSCIKLHQVSLICKQFEKKCYWKQHRSYFNYSCIVFKDHNGLKNKFLKMKNK